MQLPNRKTPVWKCLGLAAFSGRMLAKHDENPILAVLGSKLDGVRGELRTAERHLEDMNEVLVLARVDVVYENHASDRWLRRLQKRAEIVDGCKGGRLYTRLFPDGAQAIIRRQGMPQVERMKLLELRMAAIQDWPDAPAQLAELALHRSRYEAAVMARTAAEQRVESARIARNEVKERFLDTYDEIAGQIRSLFPRDRRMQDLFFDTITSKGRGHGGAPDEELPEEPGDEADAG
jgi:hypothetical protein